MLGEQLLRAEARCCEQGGQRGVARVIAGSRGNNRREAGQRNRSTRIHCQAQGLEWLADEELGIRRVVPVQQGCMSHAEPPVAVVRGPNGNRAMRRHLDQLAVRWTS
jgi:hypothetical protein